MKKNNSSSPIKIIIVLLAAGFLFYVGSIFYHRNFNDNNNKDSGITDEKTELEKLKNRPPINTELAPPENEEKNDDSSSSENTENTRESQFEISRDDCDSECKNYQTTKEIDYCRQVCGLNSTKNPTVDENTQNNENEGCEELSGLEQDYCWRDQAITEKNFEKCQKIRDGNVYNQCRNRITEDLIDSQF